MAKDPKDEEIASHPITSSPSAGSSIQEIKLDLKGGASVTSNDVESRPSSIYNLVTKISAKNSVSPSLARSLSTDGYYPAAASPRSMKKKRSDASTGSGILVDRNYSFNRGRTASQNPGSSNLHQSTHQTDYQGDDVGSTKSAESAPETPRAKARTSLARVFTVQRPLSLGGREVLVGTPIKEGHVNYMLMYDMLTGIRISVGRCSAKANRDILEEDYTAAHKIAFDVKGNELAPNSGYDFKFKDYAPWIFRLVREIFKVDPVDYLLSLTGKYVLSELGSPGKSGSFFYFSQDYRFIIKTIHFSEHKFVRRILKQYYTHVKANPETLLSRIFGLHRCKLPGGKKIHFVVMGNVFPPNKDIHETYDLKGSLVGRLTPEESAKKPGAVLKDLNWLEKNRKVFLGPIKRDILVNQMEKDVAFLVANHIMDYSLLIGVHDLVKGNSHNIRDSVMSVIEPSAQDLNTHQALNRRSTMISPISVKRRQTIIEAESIKQGAANAKLDNVLPPERAFCVFYKELGGFLSTNVNNEIMRDLYYIGIIDIFTEYSGVKKFEHFFKSLTNDRHKISAVHPKEYGDRFLKFMKDAIDSAGKPAPLSPLGQ